MRRPPHRGCSDTGVVPSPRRPEQGTASPTRRSTPPYRPSRPARCTSTRSACRRGSPSPGVSYQGWTFEGGSPGPVIHVREGDWVDITLVNGGAIPHSIDFHAALTAPNKSFKTTRGRQSALPLPRRHPASSCTTAARRPYWRISPTGCTARSSWTQGGHAARREELRARSGEWYLSGDGKAKPATLDFEKAHQMRPDWVTFNGYANQYKDHPLTAESGTPSASTSWPPGRVSTRPSTSSARCSIACISTARRRTSWRACRRNWFRRAAG